MTHPPIDEQITFLYTRDLAQSASFYETVLGLTLVFDQSTCRIYHVTGQKAYIALCERPSAPEKPQGLIFTIVTQDVDGWYRHLTSNGVVCDGEPRTTEAYGIYHFFFNDPNGYRFEVQRFLDPDWSKP